jgi:hypothetical protein
MPADRQREVEVKADWKVALRFWWAFMWRLFLYNAVIGTAFTLALKQFGGRNEALDNGMLLVSAVVFLGLEIFLMRSLLSKRFGSFRIAVMKIEA